MPCHFLAETSLWISFHWMIELLHVMHVTRDPCNMGLATYGMNHFHDDCYMGHEPLPFHMIWHNTWPVFHDTLGMYTYAYMHMCAI
jgi:hypothetical protein